MCVCGGGGLSVKGFACAHNCVLVYKQIVWCVNGEWHMMWVLWWCVYISGVWCGHDGWVWCVYDWGMVWA